ncbi:hypothetical protein H6G33_13975 [Calothrix sp. FACHB-1219]|uniref:hypothetical protein n=1 Tax=unclassified Calothrix TaxID=2619626 RepID=UPI00168490B4|nr:MULTISPECIES: hypothetical protein [unclassified Calothrix]MBD2205973.1 hypothetical protein [Calothrix sp. FACHB-168]MBD2218145.1 hypothetical protein [Calothrix sp. FACHB-1219]
MTQLLALLISWLIEIPVVLIILVITKQLSSHRYICNSLFIAFAATLFTHPLAWESNQILTSYIKFPLRVAVIESFVMIIEGILYTKFLKLNWRKGLLLSILANTTSFLAGLVINQLFYS